MLPQQRDNMAIKTRSRPVFTTMDMGTPALMALTRSAVKKGINTSRKTSPTIKISVNMVGSLYSLTQEASFLIIVLFSFPAAARVIQHDVGHGDQRGLLLRAQAAAQLVKHLPVHFGHLLPELF